MFDAINIAEEILKKKKLDQWEIFFQSSSSFRAETKQLETDFLHKAEISGIAVRLIKNHKSGFSFSSNLDYTSLKETVDMAESIADVTSGDSDYGFCEPVETRLETNGFFNPDIEETSELEKIQVARVIEETAFAHERRISAIRSSGYTDLILDVEVRNSLGLRMRGKAGLATIWVELMAQSGSEQEMCYWSDHARTPKALDPARLARIGAERAINRLGGVAISSTKCPVLIENSVAASLLQTLSNSFLAESHFKKTASPRLEIGSEIFSPLINIFDSSLDIRGAHAFPFDGEGVPSMSTAVVNAGVIVSFLSDYYYSKKLNAIHTANCRRSGFDSPPFNGVTNLFIREGHLALSDLMKEVGSGVMITEVMGLHTANPISGDFSVGAAGFKISNGRIDHPVKGIAIAGNLIDLFRQVTHIGSDFQFFGHVGAPSLVVESLSISGE